MDEPRGAALAVLVSVAMARAGGTAKAQQQGPRISGPGEVALGTLGHRLPLLAPQRPRTGALRHSGPAMHQRRLVSVHRASPGTPVSIRPAADAATWQSQLVSR